MAERLQWSAYKWVFLGGAAVRSCFHPQQSSEAVVFSRKATRSYSTVPNGDKAGQKTQIII